MTFPSNYLSLSDILATECRVTCSILPDYPRHVLCHTAKRASAGADTTELPYWMVAALSEHQTAAAIQMIHLPKALTPSYRHIMHAESCIVDLHKSGPYFYEFNRHLMALQLVPDRAAASQTLMKTMLDRLAWLMNLCLFGADEQAPSVLDKLECRLFALGVKSARKFERWHQGQSHIIRSKLRTQQSNALHVTQLNDRKRKITAK